VIVVLDACHAGAFKLPQEIERQAEKSHVLFVASTSASSTAKGGGGSFTRALLEAFRDAAYVDWRFGAVTVQSAAIHAQSAVLDQHPASSGTGPSTT
jgi:hypothetical protein